MKPQTNDVALAISTHVLLNEARSSNAVLSPASIQAMLSLIAAGANGPSLEELLSFLKAESVHDLNSLSSELVSRVLSPDVRGPMVAFANGAWVDRSVSLRPSFKKVADEIYKAASWEVDFQSEAEKAEVEVNEWAKKHTKGTIEQVLPPGTVKTSTRIVLANALYFKGAWAHVFDRSGTRDRDFYLSIGQSVRVPFMLSSEDQYVSQFDGFKVLCLPYTRGSTNDRKLSMYIFLPDSRTGLPGLVKKMGSEPGFLNRYIPWRKVKVEFVALPKFKISFGIDTCGALGEMGLVLQEIDLSRMVGDLDARVSKVLHNSFVEVNEQGTEAAAVTIAIVVEQSCEPPMIEEKIRFVADHPFMFLIREDMTESVLFAGQVLDPSGGEEKKNKEESRDMYRTKRTLNSRDGGTGERKQRRGSRSQRFRGI